MGALLSFFGGSVFRMLWGEVSAWLTKRQDHRQEVERIRLQGEMDAAAHSRNLESLRLQSELGVKTIQVQADSAIAQIDAAGWATAVADVGKQTGIWFIDVWNGVIRPFLATVAICVVITEIWNNHGIPTPHALLICDAILGIYVADRTLAHRGK